jgi:hypothetical protein
MDPTFIVALIGLGGVLIGGLITAGANLALAVRREKVEAERDHQRRAIEVKRATRSIAFELKDIRVCAELALRQKHWSPEFLFTTEAWQEFRGDIAPVLSEANWRVVAVAFLAVNRLRSVVRDLQPNYEFTDDQVDEITGIIKNMEDGERALATLEAPPTTAELEQNRWQR